MIILKGIFNVTNFFNTIKSDLNIDTLEACLLFRWPTKLVYYNKVNHFKHTLSQRITKIKKINQS